MHTHFLDLSPLHHLELPVSGCGPLQQFFFFADVPFYKVLLHLVLRIILKSNTNTLCIFSLLETKDGNASERCKQFLAHR